MKVSCLHCNTSFEPVGDAPDAPAICPTCGRETALQPLTSTQDSLAPGDESEGEVCFHCGAPVSVTEGELIPICAKCRTVPPEPAQYDPLATVGGVAEDAAPSMAPLPPLVAGAFESAGKSDSLDEDAGPGFRPPDPDSFGSPDPGYQRTSTDAGLLATGPEFTPVGVGTPDSIAPTTDDHAALSAEFDRTEQSIDSPEHDPDGLLAELASAGDASGAGSSTSAPMLASDDPLATMAGLSAVDDSGDPEPSDTLPGESWAAVDVETEREQAPVVQHAAASGEGADEGWRVLKENGQVYGPFPRGTLLRWAEERKLHAHEQVSLNGGGWGPLGDQEAFAAVFSARMRGVDIPQPVSQDIRFKKRSTLREVFRTGSRSLFTVGVLALVGGGGSGTPWRLASR